MARLLSLAPLAAALLLSACAAPPISRPSMSYVAPEITASDAKMLAADSVAYLADPLPPAKTTVLLDPPSSTDHDTLTAPMLDALRARGYGVTVVDPKTGTATGEGVPLRYLATPALNGVVLRLQFQSIEAASFYPRSADGKLVPNGTPITVRGEK